jgi:hypothetical protein
VFLQIHTNVIMEICKKFWQAILEDSYLQRSSNNAFKHNPYTTGLGFDRIRRVSRGFGCKNMTLQNLDNSSKSTANAAICYISVTCAKQVCRVQPSNKQPLGKTQSWDCVETGQCKIKIKATDGFYTRIFRISH